MSHLPACGKIPPCQTGRLQEARKDLGQQETDAQTRAVIAEIAETLHIYDLDIFGCVLPSS